MAGHGIHAVRLAILVLGFEVYAVGNVDVGCRRVLHFRGRRRTHRCRDAAIAVAVGARGGGGGGGAHEGKMGKVAQKAVYGSGRLPVITVQVRGMRG